MCTTRTDHNEERSESIAQPADRHNTPRRPSHASSAYGLPLDNYSCTWLNQSLVRHEHGTPPAARPPLQGAQPCPPGQWAYQGPIRGLSANFARATDSHVLDPQLAGNKCFRHQGATPCRLPWAGDATILPRFQPHVNTSPIEAAVGITLALPCTLL